MSKRALTLFLAAAASLPLLYCGGQKDEDALMEDEAPAAAPSTRRLGGPGGELLRPRPRPAARR